MLRRLSVAGQSTFVIKHSIEVGEDSFISWGCEFLDDDLHHLEYEGRVERAGGITIGRHVLIGSHVKVLKGVRIADGSVVAANSVVTKSFDEGRVLIAGNPARVIRRGVQWS